MDIYELIELPAFHAEVFRQVGHVPKWYALGIGMADVKRNRGKQLVLSLLKDTCFVNIKQFNFQGHFIELNVKYVDSIPVPLRACARTIKNETPQAVRPEGQPIWRKAWEKLICYLKDIFCRWL